MISNLQKIVFLGVMLAVAALGAQKNAPKSANIPSADAGGIRKIGDSPVYALKSAPQIMNDGARVPPAGAGPDAAMAAEYDSVLKRFLVGELRAGAATSENSVAGENNVSAAPVNAPNPYLKSDIGPAWPTLSSFQAGTPPDIGAASALVADLKNSTVFFGIKPDARWPLASLTKLMTAVIVSENFPLNQSSTLIAGDFPAESSGDGMKIGERYSLSDLRSAMLIESSNEAAFALANFYGYGKFMAAMNGKAKEWGLGNTHFDDPAGLSSANQSTAADLLGLARHIYDEQPEIFKITRKQSAYITELNSKKRILIKAINNFAGRADFLGGKTGYTDEASGNLLSVFSYQKRPIVIVVLGTEDRFGDTEKLLNWFEANYK